MAKRSVENLRSQAELGNEVAIPRSASIVRLIGQAHQALFRLSRTIHGESALTLWCCVARNLLQQRVKFLVSLGLRILSGMNGVGRLNFGFTADHR